MQDKSNSYVRIEYATKIRIKERSSQDWFPLSADLNAGYVPIIGIRGIVNAQVCHGPLVKFSCSEVEYHYYPTLLMQMQGV